MTAMTETSRADEHDEEVVVQLMFETLGRQGSPVGSSLSSSSDGSPEGPIFGNNRGKGRHGGSVTDETNMDRARTTATMEQGIHR